jgi:hypothetical protein
VEELIHDVTLMTSQHIVELFAALLREEDQAEAMAEVYARVKAGIESFEILKQREASRLNPSRN